MAVSLRRISVEACHPDQGVSQHVSQKWKEVPMRGFPSGGRSRPRKSHDARKLALAGIATVAAFGAVASPASANFVKTLKYSCVYPYVKAQPLTVNINAVIPDSWPAKVPTD